MSYDLFGYTNGFSKNNRFVPAEIFLSSIEDPDNTVGITLDLSRVSFSHWDYKENYKASQYHGIAFPPKVPSSNCTPLENLDRQLRSIHQVMHCGNILTKGKRQKEFFVSYLGMVTNLGSKAIIANVKDSIPPSVRKEVMSHCKAISIQVHGYEHEMSKNHRCAKIVAHKFARYFHEERAKWNRGLDDLTPNLWISENDRWERNMDAWNGPSKEQSMKMFNNKFYPSNINGELLFMMIIKDKDNEIEQLKAQVRLLQRQK